MRDAVTDRDAVLAALDRMTAWSEMARSPQLTRFLDYIVKRRLDGDSQAIKAYSIAVDVFGRPADFDPQNDPIVRVQARRLRALIDQYYGGPGAEETLRILLPIGRYIPDFVQVEANAEIAQPRRFSEAAAGFGEPAVKPRGHVTVSWFVLLLIAIGVAALAYALSTWGPRQERQTAASTAIQQPHITIMEFQNLTGNSSITASVSGLAVELLDRMQTLNFIDVSYGGRADGVERPEAVDGYTLTGIVRSDPAVRDNLQYSVILTDMATNGVVWNRTLRLTQQQLADPGRIDRLSEDLLGVLGNPRGPLHTRPRQMLARTSLIGGENLYLCRLLFTMYRETSTTGAAERARSCYGSLSEVDRRSGIALAALASLTAEGGDATAPTQLDRYRVAAELISDALKALPTSSFVWEQRARLHEALGEHDLAEAAYGRALQTNPSNMDALAAHARHIAFMGHLDEAVPLAQRAVDSYTIIPDWYYGVPALAALRDGDAGRAARYAETYAKSDREIGPILSIMAAQEQGNDGEVARQLPRVLEVPSFRRTGIITQLRRRVPDAALLGRIRVSLTQAGVPPLALVTAF